VRIVDGKPADLRGVGCHGREIQKARELERIEALVQMIEPGLKDIDPKLPPQSLLSAAVKATSSMTQLVELPDVKKALKDRRFEMLGAIYDLEIGKVSIMP
jgi:hypothetical protein